MSRTYRTSKKDDRHFNCKKIYKKYYKRRARRLKNSDGMTSSVYNKTIDISHELQEVII